MRQEIVSHTFVERQFITLEMSLVEEGISGGEDVGRKTPAQVGSNEDQIGRSNNAHDIRTEYMQPTYQYIDPACVASARHNREPGGRTMMTLLSGIGSRSGSCAGGLRKTGSASSSGDGWFCCWHGSAEMPSRRNRG